MLAGELFVLLSLQSNDESFRKGVAGLISLQQAAHAVVGVIQGAAHSLINMAVESAHAGTHLMGFSAGLGLSVQSVQEWSYVAQQAGTDMTKFAQGLGMFERQFERLAIGEDTFDLSIEVVPFPLTPEVVHHQEAAIE